MSAERKVKWFMAACLAALLLLPIFGHIQVKRQLRLYRQQLEAAGEKLGVKELSPPQFPESADAAKALRLMKAVPSFVDVHPDAMKYVLPGAARVAWREPVLLQEVDTGKPNVDVWPRLRRFLQTNGPEIHELAEILNTTEVRFSSDYSLMDPGNFSYLPSVRESSVAFGAVAMLGLHDGDSQEAYESLRASVVVVKSCSKEPLMIDQLIAFAVEAIATSALWEALQSDGWSDGQWKQLQDQWSNLDFVDAATAALAMERARSAMMFGAARQSQDALGGIFVGQNGIRSGSEIANDALQNPGRGISEFYDSYPKYWTWAWIGSYQDEKRYLEFMQTMIQATRDAEGRRNILDRLPERIDAGSVQGLVSPAEGRRFDVVQSEKPLIETLVLHALRAQTVAQMAVAAIALKRYKMAHNSYPNTLGELAPLLVRGIPTDYMDGRDMRYRLNSNGMCLLYSVGNDGVDEGGDPTPPATQRERGRVWLFDGRDWVWPRAATSEEVKAYELEVAGRHGTK
jgi:hypothetical protein